MVDDPMRERELLPNAGRQTELDFARGLAVFFMIAVHVLELLGNPQVANSWLGYVIGFLGGPPAAPVFMFLLGVGIVYSTRTSSTTLARRGLVILGLGYVLNVLRGSLPILVAVGADVSGSVGELGLTEALAVDIFHFAGLTFLFFAIWKRIDAPDTWLAGVPLLALALNGVFKATVDEMHEWSLIAQAATGLVWGSSTISYFPFLSWIVYPVLGHLLGQALIRTQDKQRFYQRVALVGIIPFVGGIAIGAIGFGVDLGYTDEYAYYHHGLVGALVFAGFTLLWFSMLFWLKLESMRLIATAFKRWSRNVSPIYFIHWVILGWTTAIVGENSLGATEVLVGIFMLTLVSDVAAAAWARYRSRKSA